MQANISIIFLNGVGQVEVELIRNGSSCDLRATDKTATLHFPDVENEDVLSFNGACAGSGEIVIDVATLPHTPLSVQAGNFYLNFIIDN